MNRWARTILFSMAGLAIIGYALAGSLEPTAGPAPTMKTLQQVEPRTPLAGPTPITITGSGAFYLTEQLFAASGEGIVIQADNVDLDLNGFSVIGVPGSATTGIRVNNGQRLIRVHSGIVQGFDTAISLSSNGSVDLHDLTLVEQAIRGIDVLGCVGSRIRDNEIAGGQSGVRIQSSVDMEVADNLFIGHAIALTTNFSDLDISGNTFEGVGAAAIFPSQNVTGTITGNRILNTDETAIFLGDQVNMQVNRNTIQRAGLSGPGKGIVANSISTQGTIIGNEIYDVAQYGIESASSQITISGNIVGKSGTAGYNLVAGSRVAPVVSLSSGPGAWANIDSDLP